MHDLCDPIFMYLFHEYFVRIIIYIFKQEQDATPFKKSYVECSKLQNYIWHGHNLGKAKKVLEYIYHLIQICDIIYPQIGHKGHSLGGFQPSKKFD